MSKHETFGQKLWAYTQANGLSMTDLAKIVGASRSHISNVIASRRKPKDGWIERFADALKLTGERRRKFFELARLQRTPKEISASIPALRRQLANLSAKHAALQDQLAAALAHRDKVTAERDELHAGLDQALAEIALIRAELKRRG